MSPKCPECKTSGPFVAFRTAKITTVYRPREDGSLRVAVESLDLPKSFEVMCENCDHIWRSTSMAFASGYDEDRSPG